MVAEDLINSMIPPLKMNDSVEMALVWMDKFRLNQLPIVDNGTFAGIICEQDIIDANVEKGALIKDVDIPLINATIKPYQHYYDVIKIASAEGAKVIAVLDEANEYLGVIPVKDTIPLFSQMSAMSGPGAIMVLSMNEIDYSLAEISRLVEENQVKILSVHVAPESSENSRIRVTIKTNNSEISAVKATLERFDYNVIAYFQAEELNDGTSDRLDLLFRYLDF